ncbi:hypothetical protein EZS27_038760 [termite gut metagenome]|uniref:Uncharacterized protein n=1 Tax=termite gut metagenome TaxID=433724 RepID=A0A5J4PN34_9ZZZZ
MDAEGKDNHYDFVSENDSYNSNILTLKSNFSYNWFKDFAVYNKSDSKVLDKLSLPVISKTEVWTVDNLPTPENMKKWYIDYPQRFFFYKDIVDLGMYYDRNDFKIATVTNSKTVNNEKFILDYDETSSDSIYSRYFVLIRNNDKNYTEIELFLDASDYEKMKGDYLIEFNYDLYIVASVENYSVLGLDKTKLNLIRKV